MHSLLGTAFVAGGAYGLYRWGQNNPLEQQVYEAEMERMSHPYAHPLAEIKTDNTFYLNALEQRTSKLEGSLGLVKEARAKITNYSPANGESSVLRSLDRLLSDIETTMEEKLPAYHSDIAALRDNNTRIHWEGEDVLMGSEMVKATRPYEMVLWNWYCGSNEDRALLKREYETREALRNGEEIGHQGWKPLSQERIGEIIRDFNARQAEKK